MKRLVVFIVLALLLIGGGLVQAFDVEFSLEEEFWFPQVKMDSYNHVCTEEVQVFEGSLFSAQTALNLDLADSNWGGRLLFNFSSVSEMEYPARRFGGPYCGYDLDLTPSGTLDVRGADLMYSVNRRAALTLGYRNYLLLLGAEGTKTYDYYYYETAQNYSTLTIEEEETTPFLKEFGIRAEGLRLGAVLDIPVKDKLSVKADVGFCPFLVGEEAARWLCESHIYGEQYIEVLSEDRDQQAWDAAVKLVYSVRPNLDFFAGYKMMHLYVNQFASADEETDEYDYHDYRRWYDSHDATLSGFTVGLSYQF